MGRVRRGRERGSLFRRRRVRGVVLLSLVLVFTSVLPWGAVQIDWPQEAAAPLKQPGTGSKN